MIIFFMSIAILTLLWMAVSIIRCILIRNFNQRFVQDEFVSIEEFRNIITFTYSLTYKFWIWNFEEYFNKNYK